jgi:hypothetical protein
LYLPDLAITSKKAVFLSVFSEEVAMNRQSGSILDNQPDTHFSSGHHVAAGDAAGVDCTSKNPEEIESARQMNMLCSKSIVPQVFQPVLGK